MGALAGSTLRPGMCFCSKIVVVAPTSPLFPYTTLFRSRRIGGPSKRRAGQRPGGCGEDLGRVAARQQTIGRQQVVQARRRLKDRKSTRLNSSHRCISYAVFCLKKKNVVESVPLASAPLS